MHCAALYLWHQENILVMPRAASENMSSSVEARQSRPTKHQSNGDDRYGLTGNVLRVLFLECPASIQTPVKASLWLPPSDQYVCVMNHRALHLCLDGGIPCGDVPLRGF